MSYKLTSGVNIFVGIIFLFAVIFSWFSLMSFFEIPLPETLGEIHIASQLYCIEPLFIFFEDLLGISVSLLGAYFIYFSLFTIFILTFIFCIALAVRQMLMLRSLGLTIVVYILNFINIIYAMFCIIIYLYIEAFSLEILIPSIIIVFLSVLCFVINLLALKKSLT